MSKHRRFSAALIAIAGSSVMTGCIQTPPIPVSLPSSIGGFQVLAGETAVNTGTLQTGDTGGITIGSGSLSIPMDAITVQESAAKTSGQPALTSASVIQVVARVDAVDQIDTVCTDGELYPPLPQNAFMVQLDENHNVVSIDPPSVPLGPRLLAGINAGVMSICLETTAPFDGTVTIRQFELRLGL